MTDSKEVMTRNDKRDLFIELLANPAINLNNKKLAEQIDVNENTIRRWKNDEILMSEVLGKINSFKTSIGVIAFKALLKKIESGDSKMITLGLEMSGIYNPKTLEEDLSKRPLESLIRMIKQQGKRVLSSMGGVEVTERKVTFKEREVIDGCETDRGDTE